MKERVAAAVRALRLAWSLVWDQRVGGSEKFLLLLGMVFWAFYLISPVDLIPEAVFGPLGFVDDAALLVAVCELFVRRCPNDVVADVRRRITE